MPTSKLFSCSQRMHQAIKNSPPLKRGETGEAIGRLQVALIAAGYTLPISTAKMSKAPDQIFGAETQDAVHRFQNRHNLKSDGVPGANTLKALDRVARGLGGPVAAACGCGTGKQISSYAPPACRAHAARRRIKPMAIRPGLGGNDEGEDSGEYKEHTKWRPISAWEMRDVTDVYWESIDYERVYITNGTGVGGYPWTYGEFSTGGHIVWINVGHHFKKTPRSLLMHELAHAWQCQHHLLAKAYLTNSFASQALAKSVSEMYDVNASAYAFREGLEFGEYSAEQIAEQVEHNYQRIITRMRGAKPHAFSRINDLSLGKVTYEIVGAEGVTRLDNAY